MNKKEIQKIEKEQKKIVNQYKKEYKEYVVKDLLFLMGDTQDKYKKLYNEYNQLSQEVTNIKRSLTLDMDTKKIEKIKSEIDTKEADIRNYKIDLDKLAAQQQAFGELIDEKVGFKVDYSNIFTVIKLIFHIISNPDNQRGCR